MKVTAARSIDPATAISGDRSRSVAASDFLVALLDTIDERRLDYLDDEGELQQKPSSVGFVTIHQEESRDLAL